MKCSQKGCEEQATTYVIWVDGKHVYGCISHSLQLQNLATVLGCAVALYPYVEEATS